MPMTRVLLAALTLLTTGLAGCIGGVGEDEGLPTDEIENTGLPVQPDVPLGFGYHGCVEQSGFFPFPREAATGFLPEGFEPVPFDADPTGSTVLFAIFTLVCDHAGGADMDVEGAAEMMGVIFVEPPAEFKADGIDLYAIHLGVFVSDPAIEATYKAWNIPEVYAGDVSLENVDLPIGALGTATAGDGSFTVHLLTEVVDQGATQGAGVARAFGIVDGKVTNAVDIEWTEAPMLEGPAEYILEGGVPTSPFELLGMVGLPGFAVHAAADDYTLDLRYVPLDVEPPADEAAYGR